jgi:hypothetical protein
MTTTQYSDPCTARTLVPEAPVSDPWFTRGERAPTPIVPDFKVPAKALRSDLPVVSGRDGMTLNVVSHTPRPGDSLAELHSEWARFSAAGSPHSWSTYVLLATGYALETHLEGQQAVLEAM